MKKFIVLLIGVAFCGGCYIPAPSVGIKPLQTVETYERVCVTMKNLPRPTKIETRCQWVRKK